MRASDADRDLVVQALANAYSEGRLSRDEHDERLDAAISARTFGELEPLTADLGVAPLSTPAPAPVPTVEGRAWSIDRSSQNANADTVVAIFGGASRRGAFRARRNISALTMFGGIDIDLREAVFEDDVCEIQVFCMFGGVDVLVPDGVRVQDETINIFAGTDVKHLTPPEPGVPTVIVKGFVAFGGVDVKGSAKKNK